MIHWIQLTKWDSKVISKLDFIFIIYNIKQHDCFQDWSCVFTYLLSVSCAGIMHFKMYLILKIQIGNI